MGYQDIPHGPGRQYIKRQRFDAIGEIAELWPKAYRRSFVGNDAQRFKALIAHEYGEQYAMKRLKQPFHSLHPDAWVPQPDGTFEYWPTKGHFGADEIAPLGRPGVDPYRHYEMYGIPSSMKPPWPK